MSDTYWVVLHNPFKSNELQSRRYPIHIRLDFQRPFIYYPFIYVHLLSFKPNKTAHVLVHIKKRNIQYKLINCLSQNLLQCSDDVSFVSNVFFFFYRRKLSFTRRVLHSFSCQTKQKIKTGSSEHGITFSHQWHFYFWHLFLRNGSLLSLKLNF